MLRRSSQSIYSTSRSLRACLLYDTKSLHQRHLAGITTAPPPPPLTKFDISFVESEDPLRYKPGGYHQVDIGDILQDRYRILNKLGHGTYSTSWLVRDTKSRKLVALQVGISKQDIPSHIHEGKIISSLNKAL